MTMKEIRCVKNLFRLIAGVGAENLIYIRGIYIYIYYFFVEASVATYPTPTSLRPCLLLTNVADLISKDLNPYKNVAVDV